MPLIIFAIGTLGYLLVCFIPFLGAALFLAFKIILCFLAILLVLSYFDEGQEKIPSKYWLCIKKMFGTIGKFVFNRTLAIIWTVVYLIFLNYCFIDSLGEPICLCYAFLFSGLSVAFLTTDVFKKEEKGVEDVQDTQKN